MHCHRLPGRQRTTCLLASADRLRRSPRAGNGLRQQIRKQVIHRIREGEPPLTVYSSSLRTVKVGIVQIANGTLRSVCVVVLAKAVPARLSRVSVVHQTRHKTPPTTISQAWSSSVSRCGGMLTGRWRPGPQSRTDRSAVARWHRTECCPLQTRRQVR
jgi:hypothetical protein